MQDNELLKYFYEAFSYSLKNNWKLSAKEKQVMDDAYEEREDAKNFIKKFPKNVP